jgi:hypothetical protein
VFSLPLMKWVKSLSTKERSGKEKTFSSMITTFLNLSPFDKSLVFFGSILLLFVFIFLIRQIRGYLSKIDNCYLAKLEEFANHNRVEAAKAGHVALHELSFSSHG